ncbi:MAG: helical backbone metal receptor [Candidatus Aminicenantes bacterium]|nr:helical backbone metal receptor [Candidatus Aminicenantes bacterium]
MFFALILAATAVAQAQAIKVTDDIGTVFTFPAPPSRIISLAPNITEVLFALGLGDRIIAVTRYCDYPEAAQAKGHIGGMLDPDIERIKALSPDLIVAFRGNPLNALAKLRELGLPVFTLDIHGGIDAVPGMVAKIGAVTGRTAQADAIRDGLAAKERAVATALASVRTIPRVFLSLQGSGLWTFGRESYFNDLLSRAKAVSVTAGLGKAWLEYSREALIKDDPDAIVVLAQTGDQFRAAVRWFEGQAGLNRLRAVREKRFLHLDQNAASRFGPRLYDALAALARRLHPEAFPPPTRR